MILSLNWIKSYLDIEINTKEDVEDLCKRLTNIGLEVANVKMLSENFKDIVTAQIVEKANHPNAEKLSLCKVDAGDRIYDLVCGATNHKAGDKVVLAKIGSSVYFDDPEKIFKLKKTKIRGEVSEGMLCSYEELCLPGDSSGIIILPQKTPIGIDAARVLNSDDVIIEIELTPNRGDCLSHIGVAREIAALYEKELKYPKWTLNEDPKEKNISELVSISNVDFDICTRYMARIVRNIKVKPSPLWLVQRLNAVGIRSINNIVDITNFVLYEFGQPLHAFDYDEIQKVSGKKEIVVRKAQEGEKFKTLDEIERSLSSEDILICDGSRPIALGGVMGGMNSEITDKTRNVLIESAIFQPERVRKTAKRLDLQTDSSTRFEKKIDRYSVHRALDRAAELMRELGEGSIVKGYIDTKNFDENYRLNIYLDYNFLNRFLGSNLKPLKVQNILNSLGFETQKVEERGLQVLVPSWRNDIEIEVDLFEEIARLWGLDNISHTLPAFHEKFYIEKNPLTFIESLKDSMVSNGFSEVINYSFFANEFEKDTYYVSDDPSIINYYPVELANPLTKDFKVLRRSLISGLIKSAKHNFNRSTKNLKIFELGMVFGSLSEKCSTNLNSIAQTRKLSCLIMGGHSSLQVGLNNYSVKPQAFDFFDIKGVFDNIVKDIKVDLREIKENSLLHVGESAEIFIENNYLGFIGRVNPRFLEKEDLAKNIFVFELDCQLLEKFSRNKRYTPPSKYPPVSRDLALIVRHNVKSSQIVNAISSMNIRVISSIEIFDVFYGKNLKPNEKSVGIHLTYQSQDKTLTDVEIDKIEKRILNLLAESFEADLRPA